MKRIILFGYTLLASLWSQAQLKVTSFAPTTGAVGSNVSIAGGPFSTDPKNNIVYFGAVRAKVESAGSTNLIVKVPSGATHQPITVISGGQVAQSRTAFRVSDHFGQAATLIAGSFSTPSYYSNGTNQSFSLLSEDLDTDGKPDIIVTNLVPKSLAILKNTSSVNNTSFAPSLQFDGLASTTGLTTGDLNGDGRKEIITVNVNSGLASHVSVYPNTSDSNTISFGTRFDSSIGNGATGVCIGDLNGDGRMDIITLSGNSYLIHYFLNTGTGSNFSFAPGKTIELNGRASYVEVADMNGDGKNDILTTFGNINNRGGIVIFLNTTTDDNVKFSSPNSFPGIKEFPGKLTIADFDMDSRPDVAIAYLVSANQPAISIFRNKSINNTLTIDSAIHINIGIDGGYINSGDVDGDGRVDILTANRDSNRVTIIPNLTSPNGFLFGSPISYTVKTHPAAVITTDINGDNKEDLITVNNQSADIGVLINKIGTENNPEIIITPNNAYLQFIAERGVNTQSLSYYLSGSLLTQNLQVVAPRYFQVSRSADTGYAQELTINPVNQKIDSALIYVRFRNDSVFTIINDSISHISAGAVTKKIPVKATSSSISGATKPIIHSFSPLTAASNGSTVIIRGKNFTGTNAVSFGDSAAKTFTVIADTLINAIVGNARSGFIKVRNNAGIDSIVGFVFSDANNPSIVLSTFTADGSILFNAVKGVLSKPLSYKVICSKLIQDLTISAPKGLQVSISVDSGYSQQLLIKPANGSIDRFIYVKYKTDSLAGYFIDSILHSSTGAVTKALITRIRVCDTAHPIKPIINQIATDSSIVCFKDSITLSISNQGSASRFLWHNGDTTATLRIGASTNAQVIMATNTSCFSTPSNLVRFIKNTNTKPSIGISSDSILISTSAPFYRWYFNNIRSNTDTSNRLIARRVGFYRVETSSNRQCWDASDDLPIVTLSRTTTTDTVKVRIFPNPVTGGTFTVVASLERVTNVIARVTVTDASGLVLAQTNRFIFYGREIKIPVTLNTYKGTAFVRVEINGDAETKTIILQ